MLSFESTYLRLVAVRKTAHAGHHAQHVVVDGVDANLRRASTAHRVDGHRELQRRLVDTREVARTARLVLLGLQGKRVHVDARRRRARVVLVRLHHAEVATLTLREAVLSVELQLANLHRVLARAAHTGLEHHLREEVVRRVLEERRLVVDVARAVQPGRTRQRGTVGNTQTREVGTRGTIRRRRHHGTRGATAQRTAGEHVHDHALRREVVGVVERLATVDLADEGRLVARVRAVDERVALAHPHELLHRVVKVELDLVARARDRLGTRELQLLDEVLVRLLGKAAALLRVQVDIVNVQRRGSERLHRRGRRALVVHAVDPLLELHIDAHLVVLERDERDRQTRVAAEPELQRDVQRLGGRAGTGRARVRQLGAGARGVQRITPAVLHEHQVVRVADHVIQTLDRARVLRELRPDLHPVAVLAVDALTAHLELHHLDQTVTDVVQPTEALDGRVVARAEVDRRENHLHIRAVHQVGIAVDDRSHTLVKVRLSVEGDLNGLHGKVRVALEQHLPESDLRVARDVDILRAIRDKL